MFFQGDRESAAPPRRKTSGGPGGSSEGKSSSRPGKGPRYGGKSPTPHSSDGQDGASESSTEKLMPRYFAFSPLHSFSPRFRSDWFDSAGSFHLRAKFAFDFVSFPTKLGNSTKRFPSKLSEQNEITRSSVEAFAHSQRSVASRGKTNYWDVEATLVSSFSSERFSPIDKKLANRTKSFTRNSFFLRNNTISVRWFWAKT